MRLATSTSDFNFFADRPEGILELYAKTPFRYADLDIPHAYVGADWESYADRIGNAAARLGLTFIQSHSADFYVGGPRTGTFHLDNLKNALRLCRTLGIPKTVIHAQYTPFIPCENGSPERLAEFRRYNKSLYEQLIPTMEETGVSVLVENSAEGNVGQWCYFMTGAQLAGMVDEMDHPLFGAVWDTGHANMRGNDQYKDITALGKRLKAVHIQDNDGRVDEHTAPFMGTTDMDAVLQGLIDAGFEGDFVFECFNFPMRGGSWPYARRTTGDLPAPRRLAHPSVELKLAAAAWMYECGKYMLAQYGITAE